MTPNPLPDPKVETIVADFTLIQEAFARARVRGVSPRLRKAYLELLAALAAEAGEASQEK